MHSHVILIGVVSVIVYRRKIKSIERVKKMSYAEDRARKAEKLCKEIYPEIDLENAPLNGEILMRTIKCIMYEFIYGDCSNDVPTERQFAHWIALRQSLSHFFDRWKKLVRELQAHVWQDILRRTNNDKTHPLVFVFKCLKHMQEMHIRRPKISPATNRHERCYNCVDNKVCEFQPKMGKKFSYTMFLFTPLPSDKDYRTIDPNEYTSEDRIKLDIHKLCDTADEKYQVADQFCLVVSHSWGKLGRLLHNIFHLEDYMNADLLRWVSDKNTDILKTKQWDGVWQMFIGKDFADHPIERFQKGKDSPQLVVSITQIYNIVTAAINLSEHVRKK